jgi:hypothetical protein
MTVLDTGEIGYSEIYLFNTDLLGDLFTSFS